MRKLVILITVLFLNYLHVNAADVEPNYHTVSPKDGDGIYALLRRYDLNSDCNKRQFLKLNKLTLKSNIVTHKKYKLPVYLYTYNGKSIRSTIKINDWDKAVRIQKYNEKLLKKGLRKSNYRDSKILWVPYSELHCDAQVKVEKTTKKEAKKSKSVHLFGEKYADFKVEDKSLKGKVYYVVSGHGGIDPGARCTDCKKTMCEDEYAYDIALRLTRNLMQHGATVHMIIQDKNDGIRDAKYLTCDTDEIVEGGAKVAKKQLPRLVQRAAKINQLYKQHKKNGAKEQVAIFLHVDSNNKSKQQDVYFYHHKTSKSGKKLAKNIRNTFDKKYKKYQKNRGYSGYVKPRGLYVINYTQPTSVFVELANIRNKSDHRRLLLHSNRQAVANWLYEGLIQ